jgi:hypothetical protein
MNFTREIKGLIFFQTESQKEIRRSDRCLGLEICKSITHYSPLARGHVNVHRRDACFQSSETDERERETSGGRRVTANNSQNSIRFASRYKECSKKVIKG